MLETRFSVGSSPSTPTLLYKTLLFDMDGVLADTRDWVVSAFHEVSRQYALNIVEEELDPLFGRSLEECYGILAPGHPQDILVEAHRAFQRKHPELIRPFPGVLDVLEWLRSTKAPMCIVTGRRNASARVTMDRLGLTDYFDFLVAGDDTPRQKPDPDPVLYGLKLLGAHPSDALMIGDAPSDILSARAAGCDTCAALYGFVGMDLMAMDPTYSIASILELPEILRI